jgi:predicted porin
MIATSLLVAGPHGTGADLELYKGDGQAIDTRTTLNAHHANRDNVLLPLAVEYTSNSHWGSQFQRRSRITLIKYPHIR